MDKQIHNINPVYDENSRILILGSFPSVKSRETEFYYGHPHNRFWKVISSVTNSSVPKNTEEKKKLLLENKIAVWDVIGSCEINGSSDSTIKNVIPNDINQIISNSNIKIIFLNGKTAEKYYNKFIKSDIEYITLSSTSPANAAKTLDMLINEWSIIKKYL